MKLQFCYFRKTEAHDGIHVREAEDQRRHDAGDQVGETHESHEQGQTVKMKPHPHVYRPHPLALCSCTCCLNNKNTLTPQ